MSTELAVPGSRVRGPHGRGAAGRLATLLRDPLAGYLGMYASYGDTIRVPISPKSCFFVLSRPEYAEHVLASNQDNYVKAFTYRPLRALMGNGLLTSEGEDWRRHRRLIQPLFSRRDVGNFGPPMTEVTRRMLKSWEGLPGGTEIDVAARMSALALEIVGQALFGTDLSGDAAPMSRAISAGQKVAMLATFVPLSWGPRSTRALKAVARRAGGTPEGIDGLVDRMIAERRALTAAAGDGNGAAPGRRDLLHVL